MKKLFFLLALLNLSKANAQLWMENSDKYPDIKTKGVYIVMNDTTSKVNNSYWNIYKKYWTYSTVQFISYEEMDKYIQPGNYFFTVMRDKLDVTSKHSSDWKAYYECSLQLWEYKGKSMLDVKEEILNGGLSRHIACLAGTVLFSTEEQAFYNGNYRDNGEPSIPKLTFYTNCNYAGVANTGNSIYFNWSEGLLKNYLQGCIWYIEQHKNITNRYRDIYEKKKMEFLKHDTLFIPDFAFTEYNLSNKNTEIPMLISKKNTKIEAAREKQNIKTVFRKYKYPYKVISSQELNNKLLNDTKPFFYFMYTINSAEKLITIINSANGENIYFTWSTKGENVGGILTSHLKEIKLLPEDIDVLSDKMLIK